MKNILQEIVAKEVNRHYKFEKDFYEGVLGVKQPTWNRWKKGDRGLSDEKMNSVKALFTDYEWMLVNKVASDMQMYPSNFTQEPFETYVNVKRSIAKQWAEKAEISVNAAHNVDDANTGRIYPGTEVKVSIQYDNGLINSSDSLLLYTQESSGNIKSGKQNRLKWFFENIDSLQ